MLKKKHPNEETATVNGSEIEVGKPSISATTIFCIVGALFGVLVFAMFFFRYNSASPFYNYYNKPTAPTSLSLNNSVSSALGRTTSGKPVEVRLTEEQVGTAVCIACDSFPLKKSSLKITPDGVVISGKTTTAFWGVSLETTLMPKVDNGQLAFDLTNFKAAGVSAPPKITETYSSKISDLFKNILPAGQTINVTEVHSLVGSLLIIGTKR